MEQLDKIYGINELKKKIKYLLEFKEGKDYIKENFEKIKKLFFSKSKNGKIEDFFEFIYYLKDIKEFEEEYNDYTYWIDLYNEVKMPEYKINNPTDVFEMSEIELRKINSVREGKIIKDHVFLKIFKEAKDIRQEKAVILQEVAKDKTYEFRGCGTTSFIIQAGDQVVKLGEFRRKFEIPYHPRIMMPYFRKKYNNESCLEVFNYGDIESAEVTDEKVLEIYKELEDAGIIWGDASKRNLVVLTKDNNLPDFIKSKEFNIFGFLDDSNYPTNNHVSLKKGDIVICDLDMLYVKGDPETTYGDIDDIIHDYRTGKIKGLRDKKLRELFKKPEYTRDED